jgi:hypothetical protein
MPKRNEVFTGLVTAFQGITTTAGYNYTVKTVERTSYVPEQLDSTKLPAILIYDSGIETPVRNDANATVIAHDMTVKLVCFFRAESDLEVEFNKFMADIMRVIYAPPTFASGIDNFRFTQLQTFLAEPPDKIAVITVKLTYWFNKANP